MQDAYDIVIIGGGTAGCVLANRLSEDPAISVLLLEAGENRSDDMRVVCPGEGGALLGNPDFDWDFETVPQDGLDGRTIKHPRGKVVGGSSAINSFALIYPSKTELDNWAALGNTGWDSEGISPYLRKFQAICRPSPEIQKELSIDYLSDTDETCGPIQASFPRIIKPLEKAWVDTHEQLDFRNHKDPCSGHALGGYISSCHVTGSKSERSHAGTAYLDPVSKRANLDVCTGAHVGKIRFAKNTVQIHTAVGVVYRTKGETHEVKVTREVVLAAGTFGSPQVLELSGYGNKERLESFGIESLYENNGIGENLQDHVNSKFSFETTAAKSVPDLAEARKQYEKTRKGPLASLSVHTFANMPLMQFLSLDEQNDLKKTLEAYNKEISSTGTTFEKARFSFIRNAIESPSQASATTFLTRRPVIPDPGNYFTVCAMLSHSFSKGNVHIQSPNPLEKPLIDFKYLSHPLDSLILGYHMRSLHRLAQTSPLSTFLVPNGKTLPPGQSIATQEAAAKVVKDYCWTNYHPCSTCAMLPETMGGVVDEKLKVYGSSNVRVVDASVFPVIPRGNIITMVYAVAEKAADIIGAELGIRRMS